MACYRVKPYLTLCILYGNCGLIFSIGQDSLLLMLSGIVTAQHFSSKTYSRYMAVLSHPTISLLTVRKLCVRLWFFSDFHVCSTFCMLLHVPSSVRKLHSRVGQAENIVFHEALYLPLFMLVCLSVTRTPSPSLKYCIPHCKTALLKSV